ncbi:MAG: XdhC family protein [Anaerolineales bacterium]|nr:MAG: XdhC family protein [Anaerolineales bacterium]
MSIYRAVVDLENKNQPGALCTIIQSHGSTPRRSSSKMLVYPDGSILGTIGGGVMESRVIAEALQAMQEGNPRLLSYSMSDPQRGDPGVCGGQLEIYVEPIQPKPVLVVIGAGHVGKAVAYLAKWLGFRVVISDDRPDFCNPEAIPDGDEFYPVPLAELSQHLEITPWSYLVLTTRGVDIDVPGLPSLLNSQAAYIGVIGSRRRWETTRKQLFEVGVERTQLDKVRSPVGLELNAETPEEIAVSILAEIILLRRGGDGTSMGN